MRDFATSDNAQVQAQLDRLAALSLPQGRFGLETITQMLGRLGNPQDRLPPVFHVAGTNGKGSTCAYLVAMLEAQGLRVHAATKPHLVRYNERIRLDGRLIEDAMLAALLKEVLDASEGLGPSFFEVTTAAMFVAFARVPADACVIEVGLGGRFDATNVVARPAICGIASLGIDHEAFLLRPEEGTPTDPMERIAFEKASIAKPGVALVTQAYPANVAIAVERTAQAHGARTIMRGRAWWASAGDELHYRDAMGELDLPLPPLVGAHQADNAALAVAMLRHQDALAMTPEAMATGIRKARWPARLQRLGDGPVTAFAPDRTMWLDGGHNPDAGAAIAEFFSNRPPFHLIIGMLAGKDPSAIVEPLRGRVLSVTAVPVPGHESHDAAAFTQASQTAVRAAPDLAAALAGLPDDGADVLIAGSLYLAGEVLRFNRELPD